MHPKVKIILKIAGIALSILLVLWLGIAAYVTTNKKALLESVTAQLNRDITGELKIENMEPDLIRGFPGISVSLKNILLRDSLYQQHHHDLLVAKEATISLNIFSLLSGSPDIKKLTITNGKIYLFTDSLGNTNTSVFRRSNKKKNGKGGGKRINRIEFVNVSLIQENISRKKLFNFDIDELTVKLNYNNTGWKGNVNVDLLVNSLSFNTKRGSFIKNKQFKADLDIQYKEDTGVLNIPLQDISIDKIPFKIGGNFTSTDISSAYKLQIVAPEIELNRVKPLLANNISSKLGIYDLKEPFFAQVIIQGSLKQIGDPRILVSWKTTDNTLKVSGETINNCSFTGYFDNEIKPSLGKNDANSVIGFNDVKGSYFDIPFSADTIRIINLRKPIFEGRFRSSFALVKLNTISGGQTFHFDKGNASLNIFYRAPYNKSNSVEPFIYGAFKLSNAGLTYRPRNLPFKNLSGAIQFKGQDLFLQNWRVSSGSSSFLMQGSLANFLNLYYTDPKKIRIDWHITSPQINLGEFLAFLGKRKKAVVKTSTNSSGKVFAQLERVLDEASVHFDLKAGKLLFRRFTASNIHSNIVLNQAGIDLKEISLNNSDGRLQVKGNIDQSGAINRFNIDTRITNVNLTKLFYAFENFGQDALAYQNLRGSFSSRTQVSGSMKDNGEIIPKSFNGLVSFDIKNGALVNFEPLQKVGSFAFPNRDFSNITFTSLKNTFDIKGKTITIRPMVIESSVLNMSLEGIYGMPTGTDIVLRVPLRNPKRDEGLSDSLKRKRFDNGIVINLRAIDDENGNVKIKLGKRDEEKDKKEEEKEIKKEEREREKELKKEAKELEKQIN